MHKKLNILILFNDPYPIGQAATNRIHSIAKGLNENGINSEVIILRPTENDSNITNLYTTGLYDSIRYEYLSNSTVKSSSRQGKIKQLISSRLKFCGKIITVRKKINAIIYPLDSFGTLLLLKFLLLFSNIKIIRHVDEYPPFVLNPNKYSWFYILIYKKIFYKLVHAVLPMTKKLEEYYRTLCNKNTPFLHLPMTVDIERFNIKLNNKPDDEFITYCGNLGHNNKDGLPDLIQAFNLVNKVYPKIKLKIIGGSRNETDITNLSKLANKLLLDNNIVFTGNMPSNEIPMHLCNSKILVLSRPNNKQAEGGFPTKLGEYLATGNPVVVTDVGEITAYLKDGISAFIAKPSNYIDFSKKLIEVLSNYGKAITVGKQGKKVALQHFDYQNQGKLLSTFIKSII